MVFLGLALPVLVIQLSCWLMLLLSLLWLLSGLADFLVDPWVSFVMLLWWLGFQWFFAILYWALSWEIPSCHSHGGFLWEAFGVWNRALALVWGVGVSLLHDFLISGEVVSRVELGEVVAWSACSFAACTHFFWSFASTSMVSSGEVLLVVLVCLSFKAFWPVWQRIMCSQY